MFKFIAVIFFIFYSSFVSAKPVTIIFNKVELVKFIDGTYGEILHKDFVISPELLAQGKKITIRVTRDDQVLETFLKQYLSDLGIEQRDNDGVIYFGVRKANDAVQSYQPSPALLSQPVLSSPFGSSSVKPYIDKVSSAGVLPVEDRVKQEIFSYTPVARTSEFLCTVLVAVYSAGSCHPAGPVLLLKLLPDDMDRAKELIKEVDTLAGRVRINATFVEVTTNGRDGFGASIIASVLGAQVGVTIGSPSSTAAISIKSNNFSAVIDAISRDSRFKQVSSPSGAVYSGEKFSITTGEDVPTLGDIQLDNQGNSKQGVIYRPSGVILEVFPRVVRSDAGYRVDASIRAQVSSFVATTTGVNGSPTLSKREVQTVQSLASGDVIVIGGLTSTRSTSSKSTLFSLPFGSGSQSDSTELVLVLSASVE